MVKGNLRKRLGLGPNLEERAEFATLGRFLGRVNKLAQCQSFGTWFVLSGDGETLVSVPSGVCGSLRGEALERMASSLPFMQT